MTFHVAQQESHHTRADVKVYAEVACRIAEELELDDIARSALLPAMLNLLAMKQIWYEQMAGLGAMAIPRNHGR